MRIEGLARGILKTILVLFSVGLIAILIVAPVLGYGDWRIAKEILGYIITLVAGGLVGVFFRHTKVSSDLKGAQDERTTEWDDQTRRYFISYATGDAAIAGELREEMEKNGSECFMAEKDIQVAAEWQDSIREALYSAKQILILLTPRSIDRPWILMETGAAWALGKPIIPALAHVSAGDLPDPIRQHQARVIETTAQRIALVDELSSG